MRYTSQVSKYAKKQCPIRLCEKCKRKFRQNLLGISHMFPYVPTPLQFNEIRTISNGCYNLPLTESIQVGSVDPWLEIFLYISSVYAQFSVLQDQDQARSVSITGCYLKHHLLVCFPVNMVTKICDIANKLFKIFFHCILIRLLLFYKYRNH